MDSSYRNTRQFLAPAHITPGPAGAYEIYPSFPLGSGKIAPGFDALARQLSGHRQIMLDGYIGVFWTHLREALQTALTRLGIQATWQCVESAWRPSREIESLVAPFLGGDDPIFGRRFTGSL